MINFVNILKSAANGYGTERRVLLLHGPVGSSKSTLARLLKKGLERYSRVEEGSLYSFGWKEEGPDGEEIFAPCPMHEEPLHLIPQEHRAEVTALLEQRTAVRNDFQITIEGDLCPFCRQMFNERMERYGGDWSRVVEDVRVRRMILSEQDRIGIGTFQPKDEKNQDATELTGDINYRKIAEYGTESDPRAFNFDGEFNIANRGIIEFIEVLKLDVAFLYDLLGRQPGTQDQAQEVRPDRHRRGHHRSHQRAGIQEAPVQRVHGGAARPDRQDRRPLRDAAGRRDQDLREGLQQPQGPRQAAGAAHARGRRDVGRPDPARRAQERRA